MTKPNLPEFAALNSVANAMRSSNVVGTSSSETSALLKYMAYVSAATG